MNDRDPRGRSLRLAGAGALATAAFGALVLAWSLWGGAYRGGFRHATDFGLSFVGLGRVEVVAKPGASGPGNDTLLVVADELAGRSWFVEASSFFSGYFPLALFLAAFVGLVPLRRSARGLLTGLLALHAYVFLRLVVALFHGATTFASEAPASSVAFLDADGWRLLGRSAAIVLLWEPTVYALVPVLILVVVCARRNATLEELFVPRAARAPGARA